MNGRGRILPTRRELAAENRKLRTERDELRAKLLHLATHVPEAYLVVGDDGTRCGLCFELIAPEGASS